MSKNQSWIIEVPAWGILYAIGTEEQAEEWRCHKANYEQSVARKRVATEKEVREYNLEDGRWKLLSNLL